MARLRDEPGLIEPCLTLLESWLASPQQRPARVYLEQWHEMLRCWPIEKVAATVLDEHGGQALRQCSPLGPTLTPRERWALLAEINQQLKRETKHP